MTNYRRLFAYGLLIGSMTLLPGCFGSFELTRSIYRANRNVYGSVSGDHTQRKIAQSAVMWLFIPVYAVAGVADAAVFNVIEFWTGKTTEVGSVRDVDGSSVALMPSADGREALLTVSRGGKVISQEHLIKVSDRLLEIRDTAGALKGTMIQSAPDKIEMRDPAGRTLQTYNTKF